jgi:hypothetical protein
MYRWWVHIASGQEVLGSTLAVAAQRPQWPVRPQATGWAGSRESGECTSLKAAATASSAKAFSIRNDCRVKSQLGVNLVLAKLGGMVMLASSIVQRASSRYTGKANHMQVAGGRTAVHSQASSERNASLTGRVSEDSWAKSYPAQLSDFSPS